MFSSKRERTGAELLPRSDEAFAERLDMLATTVSSTAAGMARTDGDIASLRRELGNGLARFEELAAEMRSRARAGDVRELEKKVTALTFERAKTSDGKRIDDLAAKVGGLAERVDTLAATVATAASSVAGRDGEVAALRRQLDEAPRAATPDPGLQRRFEEVAAASASASLRLESQAEQIGEIDSRLETVEARLDELGRRLDGVDEQVTSIAAELARATSLWPTALRSLESRVEELTSAPRQVEMPQPAVDTHVLAALRALEQRMQTADAAAHDEREALLDRLERLAGRLEVRSDFVPVVPDVVPFGTTDT